MTPVIVKRLGVNFKKYDICNPRPATLAIQPAVREPEGRTKS
jgi:hypothetical protein